MTSVYEAHRKIDELTSWIEANRTLIPSGEVTADLMARSPGSKNYEWIVDLAEIDGMWRSDFAGKRITNLAARWGDLGCVSYVAVMSTFGPEGFGVRSDDPVGKFTEESGVDDVLDGLAELRDKVESNPVMVDGAKLDVSLGVRLSSATKARGIRRLAVAAEECDASLEAKVFARTGWTCYNVEFTVAEDVSVSLTHHHNWGDRDA